MQILKFRPLFLLLFKTATVLEEYEQIDLFKIIKGYEIDEYYDNYILDLLYKNVEVWIHYQIGKLNDYHYIHTYEEYIVFASKFLNSLNQD